MENENLKISHGTILYISLKMRAEPSILNLNNWMGRSSIIFIRDERITHLYFTSYLKKSIF